MANPIARRLRKTLTPQEVKVWNRLRSWRKQGFHFRRQAPRRGYIVDFVCLKHRLIIEIDGGQHNVDPHRASDHARDRELSRAPASMFFVFGTARSIKICKGSWKRFTLCSLKEAPTRPPSP